MSIGATTGVRPATRAVDSEELGRLIGELIDIPSPTGAEEAAALYLADRLEKAGLKPILQEVEPGRLNVVARLRGDGSGPNMLYVGHLDTTWAGDEEGIADLGPGFKPRAVSDGDWIHGMGAYNMKSGLAAMVYAVETVARHEPAGLKGDLILAAVVGETVRYQVGRHQGSTYRGTGAGARFLMQAGVTADAAVIAEPTAGLVDIATGGLMVFEIVTRAAPRATYRRATDTEHNTSPDAIQKMHAIAQVVSDWKPGFIERTRYMGQALGNVTLYAVEGGHPWRPSKTAPYCRAYVELDIMPGANQTELEREFRAVVAAVKTSDGSQACESVELVHNVEPAEAGADEFFIGQLLTAHERIHGRSTKTVAEAWYCDSTHLTTAGLPTLIYGPGGRAREGGENFYSPSGEACYVPDILDGTRVFVELAYDFCNSDVSESVACR